MQYTKPVGALDTLHRVFLFGVTGTPCVDAMELMPCKFPSTFFTLNMIFQKIQWVTVSSIKELQIRSLGKKSQYYFLLKNLFGPLGWKAARATLGWLS